MEGEENKKQKVHQTNFTREITQINNHVTHSIDKYSKLLTPLP